MDWEEAYKAKVTKHHELEDFRHKAYESSPLYKEKMNKWNVSKILNWEFHMGDNVLLYNYHLKIFMGKHRSKWPGPFVITNLYPSGVIE